MLNARERRRLQAKSEAVELIGLYGEARTAAALNVHTTTVRRWYSGDVVAPTPVLIALRALALGQVPGMDSRHWQGWTFGRDGKLYMPDGHAHDAGSIMAMQYERQLIKHLQNENKDLQARLAKALEEANGAANDPALDLKVRRSQ